MSNPSSRPGGQGTGPQQGRPQASMNKQPNLADSLAQEERNAPHVHPPLRINIEEYPELVAYRAYERAGIIENYPNRTAHHTQQRPRINIEDNPLFAPYSTQNEHHSEQQQQHHAHYQPTWYTMPEPIPQTPRHGTAGHNPASFFEMSGARGVRIVVMTNLAGTLRAVEGTHGGESTGSAQEAERQPRADNYNPDYSGNLSRNTTRPQPRTEPSGRPRRCPGASGLGDNYNPDYWGDRK